MNPRFSSPSSQLYGDADHFESMDAGIDGRHNSSFQSALSMTSATASASSSKAVLAALRALQDKIRRLEAERSQALDESTQLKHQLRNQEIEIEHVKQKESLMSQKSLQEARNAYEKLLSEKSELEVRVARHEERNRDARQQSEEMQDKIRRLEEERHQLQLKSKELESEHLQFDLQIQTAQRKEKDLAQSMVWETRKHEEDIRTQERRLDALQDELESAVREKSESDARLSELDSLVAQLLHLNEVLVAKLSGRPARLNFPAGGKTVTAPGMKKKKTSSAAALVPRAAMLSTVASEHSRFDWSKNAKMISVEMEDIQGLRRLHEMFRDAANSIKSSSNSSRSSRRSSASPGRVGGGGSGAGSGGGGGGSGAKPATRMRRRKSASQLSERSVSASRASGGGIGGGGVGTSFERSIRFDESDALDSDRDSRAGSPSRRALERSGGGSRSFSASSRGRASRADLSSSSSVLNTSGASMGVSGGMMGTALSTSTSRPGPGNKRGDDLQQVISSLEDEFDSLNGQYRRLLSSVQSEDPAEDTQHAEELVDVIQKLQRKGEQLRALRSPSR